MNHGLCTESHNLEDFENCVQDIRTPYIDQINFKSYTQSYELNHAGASDFIYPGKNSITLEMSPKLYLNKVYVMNYYIKSVMKIVIHMYIF